MNITDAETWAVRWLLWQAQKGAGRLEAPILRFRQCDECRDWLYTKTAHTRFCSDACKKKFHSHNPEFKEKRALYMRTKRHQAKEQDKQWWQEQNRSGYKKERRK
jgi:hypothetical protein